VTRCAVSVQLNNVNEAPVVEETTLEVKRGPHLPHTAYSTPHTEDGIERGGVLREHTHTHSHSHCMRTSCHTPCAYGAACVGLQ
jgi:hypothetical protein